MSTSKKKAPAKKPTSKSVTTSESDAAGYRQPIDDGDGGNRKIVWKNVPRNGEWELKE